MAAVNDSAEADGASAPQPPKPIMHTMKDDAEGRPAPSVPPVPAAPPPSVTPKPTAGTPPITPTSPTPTPAPPGSPPLAPDELLAAHEESSDEHTDEHTAPDDPFAGDVEVESGGAGDGAKKKMIIIGGGILLILLLVGGGIVAYQQNLFGIFKKTTPTPVAPTPEPEPEPTPEPEPEPTPEPVISVNEVLKGFGSATYSVADSDEAQISFFELISRTTSENDPTTLRFTDEDGVPFLLDSTFESVGIIPDSDTLELLDNTHFSLLVMHDTESDAARIAIVAAILDGEEPENLSEQATAWEASLLEDTENLFNYLGLSESPAEITFATFTRDDGITIHYANLSGPSLAIDYAIDKERGYFIFATSRESMSAIIDALE